MTNLSKVPSDEGNEVETGLHETGAAAKADGWKEKNAKVSLEVENAWKFEGTSSRFQRPIKDSI